MTVRFVPIKDRNLELRSVMEQEMFSAMKLKYERNMSYELSRPIPERLGQMTVKKTRWLEEEIYYDEKKRMIDRNGLHGTTRSGALRHMDDEFDPPNRRQMSRDAARTCNPNSVRHGGNGAHVDIRIPVKERPVTVLARMHPIDTALASSQKRARILEDDEEYILDGGEGNRNKRGCAEEDRHRGLV